MSTSANGSHIATATVFAVGLSLSLWFAYKHFRTQALYREHSSVVPKVSKETLLRALKSVAEGAEKVVESVNDAIAGAEGDEKEAIEVAARVTVQKELSALQNAALKELGLGADAAAAAISYFTTGSGNDVEVEEVVAKIKAFGGRYVLTKQMVLDVMVKTYQVQSELMVSYVEDAIEARAIRSPQQLQRFLGTPAFQAQMQRQISELTRRDTGLTVEEIDEITKRPEWMDDPAFQAGIASVAEAGQAAMAEANQKLGQLAQELQQKGGMGVGGMGMSGMGF